MAVASLGLSAADTVDGDFLCMAVSMVVSVSGVGAGSATGGSV